MGIEHLQKMKLTAKPEGSRYPRNRTISGPGKTMDGPGQLPRRLLQVGFSLLHCFFKGSRPRHNGIGGGQAQVMHGLKVAAQPTAQADHRHPMLPGQ